MRTFIALLSLLCGLVLVGISQNDPPLVPLQIGLGMSGHSYIGDFTEPGADFRRVYPGGNISLQFDGRKALSLQLNSGFGRFTEQSDAELIPAQGEAFPNQYVETSFFYTDLRLRYLFFRRKRIKPYIGLGVGILSFQPEDADGNFLGENIFTRLPEEFTYLSTVAQFPIAVGLQVRINPIVSIGGEYVHRLTTTDYLDNIGLLGSQAGNDVLQAIQFSIYFTLQPNNRLSPRLAESPQKPTPSKPAPIPVHSLEKMPTIPLPSTLDLPDRPEKTTLSRLEGNISLYTEWLLYWEEATPSNIHWQQNSVEPVHYGSRSAIPSSSSQN